MFVSGSDGSLEAINQTSGSRAWRIAAPDLDHFFTAPVVVGATLYSYQVGSGLLYTINASSGTVERTSAMLDNIGLVYSNGVLYTEPSAETQPPQPMGAYDVATGNLLWKANVGGLLGAPAVAGGRVFSVDEFNPAGRTLNVLDAATGKVLWSRLIGEQSNATPVVSGNTVVITTIYAHQWALNATTGAVIWKRTLSTTGGETWSAPAVLAGTLYQVIENACNKAGRFTTVVTARKLSTGAQAWSHVFENIPCGQAKVGGGGPRSPVVANGLVFLAEMNAKKVRVFTTAGKLVTVFSTGEYTVTSAVVAAGEVIVSTWDPYHPAVGTGFVQAFGL